MQTQFAVEIARGGGGCGRVCQSLLIGEGVSEFVSKLKKVSSGGGGKAKCVSVLSDNSCYWGRGVAEYIQTYLTVDYSPTIVNHCTKHLVYVF